MESPPSRDRRAVRGAGAAGGGASGRLRSLIDAARFALAPARSPATAVIAVTLNCNARCQMCDIWKNKLRDELRPEELAGLPSSLRDINISGGEPFLREDLPELVDAIHSACPDARLVISTNGFLPERIRDSMRAILRTVPRVGLRVSVDACGELHDRIRGVPGGFERNLRVLDDARELGVTDLGIGMTLMDENLHQLRPVYDFARDQALELSVTVATDSPIYFGELQSELRPRDPEALRRELTWLSDREYRHPNPKRWIRGWFERRLLAYIVDGERALPCDAGHGFFYLDSHGDVFACHVRSLHMGNLRRQPWDEIWANAAAEEARREASSCQDCWMTCTSKTAMRRRIGQIAVDVLREKLAAHKEEV